MRAVLLEIPEAMLAELLRAVGDRLLPVTADAAGTVRSEVLGAQFTTVERRLRITWEDGVADG